MADTKISDLTELTVAPAGTDELVLVDKDDTTMAASGTDKRITVTTMLPLSPVGLFPAPPASTPASCVVGVAETYYAIRVALLAPRSVAGIRYRVGTVSNGNVRVALFSADQTTKLADRTTNAAQAAASTVHTVTFDAPYSALTGTYWAVVWFSSATATFMGGRYLFPTSTGTSSGATPTSLASLATADSDFPIVLGI